MRLLLLCTLISSCITITAGGNTSPKLKSLTTDEDREVHKFLTNAYVQIGTFMAEGLFFIVPKYKDYFDVIADIGARFLSLSNRVRTVVVDKFSGAGDFNRTWDQMEDLISAKRSQIIIDILTSRDVITETEKAINFVKRKDPEFGIRLEKIYIEGKKQLSVCSPEVRAFIRTELSAVIENARRFRNSLNVSHVFEKLKKRYLKLSHSQKVEVVKMLLLAFEDELKTHYNHLSNSLTELYASNRRG